MAQFKKEGKSAYKIKFVGRPPQLLNKIFIEKEHLPFEPVSLFFRYEDWSTEEITEILTGISEEAISYYFS